MYKELLMQYERLTDEEKAVLLLYKTNLGLLLNNLSNNCDYESNYIRLCNLLRVYEELPDELQIFSLIRLDSLAGFRESLYGAKRLLDVVSTKMTAPECISVYRAVSSDRSIDRIARGNIISTSLDFGATLKYAVGGDNISIYEIEIKPGSRLAFIPKCEELKEKYKELFKDITSDEEEIILNNDIYNFEITNEYDNDSFKYIKVSATDIKNKTRI